MGISNGEIKAPLGVHTLANYFGTATDVFSICKANIINKWAKYKPIALSTLGLTDTPASLTEAQRKAANYGLQAKSARSNSKTDLPEKIMSVCGESGLWTYPHVVAGTDYARLDDFGNPNGYSTIVGYDHFCDSICKYTNIDDERKTNEDSYLYLTFTDRSKASYPGQLHFDELNNFGTAQNVSSNQTCLRNCYLCLMFKYNSEYYYIFSEDTIDKLVTANSSAWEDENITISMPIIKSASLVAPFKNITEGTSTTFTGYLCLIDLANAFDGSVPASYKGGCISQSTLTTHAYYVYSLSFDDKTYTNANFKVTYPAFSTRLMYNSSYYTSGGKFYCTITVDNKTSSQATLNTLFVHIMSEAVFDSSDYTEVYEGVNEWIESGEKNEGGVQITNGSFGTGSYTRYQGISVAGSAGVIAAGGTKSFTFTISSDEDPLGNPYGTATTIYICYQDSKSNGRQITE